MKQLLVYQIDLLNLKGKGDFLCPCCGMHISPDDETEKVYTILQVNVRKNKLENLLIQCNQCSNKILITGFSLLDE